jgi:osmotically inducible protein OsmC
MAIRSAKATWKGNLKEGKGTVGVESGIFTDVEYSFSKRFENEKGTNPEELLGAAHAACYTMALSAGLSGAGYKVVKVDTTDKVHVEKVGEGFSITKIEINSQAEIEGIDEATFNKIAEDTKKNCPVSKALTGVEFILNVKLLSSAKA